MKGTAHLRMKYVTKQGRKYTIFLQHHVSDVINQTTHTQSQSAISHTISSFTALARQIQHANIIHPSCIELAL